MKSVFALVTLVSSMAFASLVPGVYVGSTPTGACKLEILKISFDGPKSGLNERVKAHYAGFDFDLRHPRVGATDFDHDRFETLLGPASPDGKMYSLDLALDQANKKTKITMAIFSIDDGTNIQQEICQFTP